MTSLADQIIEHGPFEPGCIVLASFASELLQVGPLNQLRDELIEGRKLLAAAEQMRRLLADLVDPDPCWLDHHGYCQAHGLHSPPCPHARAKELLAELGRRADEYSEECGR